MKKVYITVLVALFAWVAVQAQSCLPGGITFLTQEQVDDFSVNYPGCVQIEGDVEIALQQGSDLHGLQALQTIGGNLTITSGSFLTNLQGLNNLVSIGGSLAIGDDDLIFPSNAGLMDLTGLDKLTTIGGALVIQNHQVLASLNGLDALTTVGGELLLYYNQRLQNIHALAKLDSIGGRLAVVENDSLTNLSGLEHLATIGSNIFISHNVSITNIDALSDLAYFNGDINIQGNSALEHLHGLQNIGPVVHGLNISGVFTSLAGLENITTVTEHVGISSPALEDLNGLNNMVAIGGLLSISGNHHLHNLIGLDSLHAAKNVSISNNNSMISLTGLNGLQSIGGELIISYNQALSGLDGLENVSHIGGAFSIDGNPALGGLAELYNLHEIGGLYINNNDALITLSGLDSIESLNFLVISDNFLLTDLSALSHLVEIGSAINILDNYSLTTLQGLQNIQSIGNGPALPATGGEYAIYNNPSLTTCSIYSVCNHLLNHPEQLIIEDNAPGCNTLEEVEAGCGGRPVLATVQLDYNGNCQADTGDGYAEGILVHLSGNLQQALRPTQADGSAHFVYLEAGNFTLSLPQFPDENWQVCQDTLWFLPDTIPEDTIRATFLLKPLTLCPRLTVDLGLPPFFRGCLVNSTIQAVTRNIGTFPAEAAQVAIVMPEGLELVSSVPPLTMQSGDTLFFDLGELPPFLDSTVNMVVKTSCAAVQLGQALCLEAFATWTNPCPVTTPPASEIRLFSECMSDTTVRFTIKNVGDAATQNAHEYVIIEDEVILHSENFSLDPLASLHVDVASDGSTYRMEATKYDDGSLTATALENCGGFTPGFITAYWLNDGLRNYDFDCREIRNAYDPNQKTAIPTGVGPEHLLAANKPIQYTIDFQNTGTDTAFRVLLRDVLPDQLDVNTFRPGFSSHPYTWEIRGGDTLEVLFFPIMLPDSNVNEAASHGWFSFDMDQKSDLPDGTTIENTASIVFDYNPPIVTNMVLHTIGKLTVRVDEPQSPGAYWQVLPNPARYTATFRALAFTAGEQRFELSDALGRVVRTEHFEGQEFEFRRGSLPGGLYSFRIMDTKSRVFSGKIVVSE